MAKDGYIKYKQLATAITSLEMTTASQTKEIKRLQSEAVKLTKKRNENLETITGYKDNLVRMCMEI